MFCPKCGKQLEDESRFCPQCGAPLPSKAQADVAPANDAFGTDPQVKRNASIDRGDARRSKRRRTVLVVAVIVLMALVAGGVLMVSRYMKVGEEAPVAEQNAPEQSGEDEEKGREDDSEAPDDASANDDVEFNYVDGKGMISTNAVAITDLTWEKVDQSQLPASLQVDAYNFAKKDAYLVTFSAENLTDESLESQIKFKATKTEVDSKGNSATNETSFLSADATGQASWTRGVLGTYDQGWFFLAPHEKRDVELYTTWVDADDRDPSPSVAVVDDVTYAGCESSQYNSLLPLTDETIKLENDTGTYDYKPTYGDSVCRGAAFSVTNTTELRMRSLLIIYGYRYGDTFAPALFYRELSDIAPGETVSVHPDEAPGRGSGEQIPASDLYEDLQMVPIMISYENQ